MKNIQIIDGAVNSTFDIYIVPDEAFNVLFPDNANVAFLSEVELRLEAYATDQEAFWARVYANKVSKNEVIGIHGTLHLTGSACQKQYFPTRQENDVLDINT